MKYLIKFNFAVLLFSVALFASCSSDNIKEPEYRYDTIFDENLNIVDMGRAGECTDDGNYYFYGYVTLYDQYGGSQDFTCYTGTQGLEKGCRGIIYGGEFYNLDRNKWIIVGGVKYKASNLVD
ncbi:MAG: hypothetical protein E7089_06705 [Bacteroidales bacterium]|nr:hypothetical protein [Bacteroidales bacterium]